MPSQSPAIRRRLRGETCPVRVHHAPVHRGRAKASNITAASSAKPVTSYKGGGSVANPPALSPPCPCPIAAGGESVQILRRQDVRQAGQKPARAANRWQSLPSSAWQPPKSTTATRRKNASTAARLAIEDYNRYKGKAPGTHAGEARSSASAWSGESQHQKRYGGKIQFTSQANYEGNQPIVRIGTATPSGARSPQANRRWCPCPTGATRAATECAPKGPEIQRQEPHRKMVGKPDVRHQRSSPATRPATKGK